MHNNATRNTLSAGTLIGDAVMNRAGETVGSLEEIMIDLETDRVAYAVVSVGGFLGIGNRLFAIPWKSLELDAGEHALILDVNKEFMEQAPGFDQDHWPDMSDRVWGQELHDYYGVPTYW
jgi:sporulation protein YlmC with PRC-barrel domain